MRGPSLDPLARLGPARTLQVVVLDGLDLDAGPLREPHRHDYHELIWLRAGTGEHLVDGEVVPARAGTVTVIGRGQVHVFRRAENLRGAVVRFADALLAGGRERVVTGLHLAGTGGRVIAVPPGEADRLDAVVGALAAEAARPPDRYSADLERDLVAVLLLWLERFEDGARTERRVAGDPDVQLHRRFAARLEGDFARFHDAEHYAEALGVPPAALARALVAVTGRGTKELVLDRVMLEASRLLRFSDATVGEVAHRVGFRDPLYFSRAFKRAVGEAPQVHRERARGGS